MSKDVRQPGPLNEETVPVTETDETGSVAVNDHPAHKGNPVERHSGSRNGEPVPILEATETILPESSSIPEEKSESSQKSHGAKLFWPFVLFVTCWLLYTTLISLEDAWSKSFWLAIPLTAITVIFIVLIGFFVLREVRAFRSIDRIEETREKLAQYTSEGSIIGVHETLKPVLENIKVRYPVEYRQFDEARHDRKTVKEYFSLLENVVLTRLDKAVDDAINRASLSVAGLVAISPHPALDAVIVVVRANILLRNIGQIYGLEITGISSLYFFKHTIVSAITAAGIEELGTLVFEEIGAGLTEKSAKIVTEGFVSAGRMYRLGRLAKKVTRPVPVK